MRYTILFRLLGLLIVFLALNMFGAFAWAIYFAEPVWTSILLTIAVSSAIGLSLMALGKKKKTLMTISRKEAIFMVGLSWFVAGLVGALPFYVSGAIPGYADAYFETISGFTTTGSSILTDIEAMPKSLLFWRSYTHWLGGMGIIVLFVAVFPFLGVSGKKMYQYEVPGPEVEGLKPKIQTSAFILWAIYVGISGIETVALRIAGMTWFDAICHTFGTMATGGFSTKNTSIAYYTNPTIHIIIIIFMAIAGMNFTLYYYILRRNFSQVFHDSEWKTFLSIILISTLVFSGLLLYQDYYQSVFQAVVDSAFTVASVMTTTGYGTADFDTWPMVTKIWLLMLMFIGGCGGSTGGGIKVVRFVILFKYAYNQIITSYSPQRRFALKVSGKPVDPIIIDRTLGFFFLYITIYAVGVLVLACYGYDFATTVSSVAACLNNIGPGFTLVGPTQNFAFMTPFAKIFLAIYMVAGRLELFAVIIYFVPDFWKR